MSECTKFEAGNERTQILFHNNISNENIITIPTNSVGDVVTLVACHQLLHHIHTLVKLKMVFHSITFW